MTESIKTHIISAVVVDRAKYDGKNPAVPRTVRALIIEFRALAHVEAFIARVVEDGLGITIKHRVKEKGGS